MARKRKSGSTGASMDSLLDTMTNVVGILVIILIVTQLGVKQAVKRITGLVTVQELEDAQKQARELEALLDKEKQQLEDSDVEQTELDIAKQQELIAALERELAELRDEKIDAESLKRDIETMEAEQKSLDEAVAAKSEKIQSLKARLAETPKGPDPDAKIVNLPDPRPAPPKAEAVEFLVKDGRIVSMEGLDELEARARKDLYTAAKTVGLGPDPENEKRARIDPEKVQEFFEKKTVQDRFFRVKVDIVRGQPQFVFVPREGVGIETDRVERGFASLVKPLRGRPVFLRFRVFSDSFDTYIEARNVASTLDLAAGWVPYAANAPYRRPLGFDFPVYVAGYEIPPPPPPGPPPDPNRPKPPPRSDVD